MGGVNQSYWVRRTRHRPIAHVAQSLGRLGDAGVKMIDNLVLGAGGQRDKDKGDGGGEFEQGFHVTLLCVARGKSGNATPFYREY